MKKMCTHDNKVLCIPTPLYSRLHKTQDLLYESTKDFLELRYQGRAHERQWMAEKDRLLREMDGFKQQLNISKESVLNVTDGTYEGRAHHIEEVKVTVTGDGEIAESI